MSRLNTYLALKGTKCHDFKHHLHLDLYHYLMYCEEHETCATCMLNFDNFKEAPSVVEQLNHVTIK